MDFLDVADILEYGRSVGKRRVDFVEIVEHHVAPEDKRIEFARMLPAPVFGVDPAQGLVEREQKLVAASLAEFGEVREHAAEGDEARKDDRSAAGRYGIADVALEKHRRALVGRNKRIACETRRGF